MNRRVYAAFALGDCEQRLVLQPAFVFPLTDDKGDELFIYVGDRWNYYGPGCVSLTHVAQQTDS